MKTNQLYSILFWIAAIPVSGCGNSAATEPAGETSIAAETETETVDNIIPPADAGIDTSTTADDTAGEPLQSCGFDYKAKFDTPAPIAASQSFNLDTVRLHKRRPHRREPRAPYTYPIARAATRAEAEILLPGYEDDIPLFERATEWHEETRCFELNDRPALLTEEEAYDLYRRIAEMSCGESVKTDVNVRTVIGLRGAYPGTFSWNGNAPDRFNDTLVLLWVDDSGKKNVREFAGHTDVGAYDFGFESSSFLPAGKRYRYINGLHGETPYSALRIAETGYTVMNDTNANGHWDDKRNGYLPPEGDDYYRTGSAHNIHVGSVGSPLGSAAVGQWSAGCQLICGMASWTEFIRAAWTGAGDAVSYFLVDTRDIPDALWNETPSH